jgi:hypothetical protein
MSGSVLAKTTLLAKTGLAADNAVMDTAWFTSGSIDSTFKDAIDAALASFYTTVQVIPGSDNSVLGWVGSAMASSSGGAINARVDLYDITSNLDGTPHGSPIASYDHSWGTAGTDPYPSEVALKLSLRANYGSASEHSESGGTPTRPRARMRGGFYIPWIINDASSRSVSAGQSRPSQDLIDTLRAAGVTLAGAVSGGLSIWSRADAVLRGVDVVSVDNAFDTIRHRGVKPTVRYTGAP